MTGSKLTAAQLKRLQKALRSVPYARLLGIELEEIEAGTATLSVKVRSELTQNHGVVHGGAIASLIDTATAFAIISLLDSPEKVTTVDLSVSFLRPVTRGRLTAAATVKRAGTRLFVVSADVFDSQKKLIATALSTYIKV
jgi:uncharacterized protein (TIGR00369 family)